MKQKQSKNLIWLTIQLINIIFQIISAITKTDGKEFFEDLQEIIDAIKNKDNEPQTENSGKENTETSQESCK